MPANPAFDAVAASAGGKRVAINGRDFHVVPSTLEATRAMWAGGVYVPGPIQNPNRFNWPSTNRDFRPMVHQVQTADMMTVFDRVFILNRPGTGKTSSAIWASEFLRREGLIDATVVVCPLSCVKDVWIPELRHIAPLADVAEAHRQKIPAATGSVRDYLLFNHDGCRNEKLMDRLMEWSSRGKRLMVIVDEATAFKNWSAARTKRLAKLTHMPGNRVVMMTGTPHPKDPTDVYGMCRVKDPNSVPRSFAVWRDMVMWNVARFKWVPKKDATQHIHRAMHPAICFRSEDCIELPPKYKHGFGDDPVPGSSFAERGLVLSAQQQEIFDALKKEAVAEIQSMIAGGEKKQIVATQAGVLRNKLFQVAQGVVLDSDKHAHCLDCSPRVDDFLRAASIGKKKFLIFCHFKAVQAHVQSLLKSHGVNALTVNGDTGRRARETAFNAYKADPKVHGLIAHPQTTAHGLNLTEGDTTFWWGPPQNPEYFDQGNHRQFRKGQKDPVHIWAQAACKEEADYFATLVERGNLEEATLRMFKP